MYYWILPSGLIQKKKHGTVHCIYLGATGYIINNEFPNNIVCFSPQIVFVLEKSVDPDEMQHVTWFFTICQNNHLGVTSIMSIYTKGKTQ